MKKRYVAVILCGLLAVLLCIPLPVLAESEDRIVVNRVAFSASTELKNRQQSDSPWGGYAVKGSANTISSAGCGILATCNALHYATGYFPDPAQLAEWANKNDAGYNGEFTEGTILFARFVDAFGEALGFHTVTYDDTEGSRKLPRVRTFVNDAGAKDVLINDFIRNGAAMVAYVENHFVAIVDYNSMTDRFLVWDNNAGDTHGGRRAGITHEAGDWFTWEEMRGTLKNAAGEDLQFNIEYVVPILPTEGRQYRHVTRDDMTVTGPIVNGLRLQKAGECCNFTPVDTHPYAGQTLTFSGTYTSLGQIDGIGYRVNGGSTVLLPDGILEASDDARREGQRWCGGEADTIGFRAAVPISVKDKQYEIVVSENGVERVIWTAVVTKKNTGEPLPVTDAPATEQETTAAGTEPTAETGADTAEARERKASGTVPRGFLIAAWVIGAACAASLPILLKTARKGKARRIGIILLIAAVCACAAFIIIAGTVGSGQKKNPEGSSSGDAADSEPDTMTMPQETETAEDAARGRYEQAAALAEAGEYEAAIRLLDALPDSADGEALIAQCERALLKTAEVGSVILFGAYEQDNDPENGKEVIAWRVLAGDGDKLLLISDKGLDCQPYNETFWSTTWERSTLRTWLNRAFLESAFTESERSMIVKTKVSADPNPRYTTTPGSAVSDKVFLISMAEADAYFASEQDRVCEPTAYAVAQGAWSSDLLHTDGAPACYWWLRTPGGTVFDAAYIHYRGTVSGTGRRVNSVSSLCVRPAVWIRVTPD